MLDKTDRHILTLLEKNSRMTLKELSELVHLTPPAVASRIQKMEDNGIIQAYTINIDRSQLGQSVHVVVTVTLIEPLHERYLTYMKQFSDHITNHYRTAGVGCYLVELYVEDNALLSDFLDGLETFASYQVTHVINAIGKE